MPLTKVRAVVRCKDCANEDFNLTYCLFDGVKDIIATCKCGRSVTYRISEVLEY
jgi:hypothetical protein